MQIIKGISFLLIFLTSSKIGYIIANKYKNRLNELKEMKNALNMLKTKMKYTYETIPDIIEEISKNTNEKISRIFKKALENMNNKKLDAGHAWREAIITSKTDLTEEDRQVLINMEKLLGKTDLEGQVGDIELTSNFLDVQIEKAEKEKTKNEKLYKTLGKIIGVTIVILLI